MSTTLNGTGVTYPDGTSDVTHAPVLTTEQNLSSTYVDVTGIPSWAKRVSLTFRNVSPSAAANISIQLGTSGGMVTSGYVGAVDTWTTSSGVAAWSGNSCEIASIATATNSITGIATFVLVTGTTWVMSSVGATVNATGIHQGAGSIPLGNTLTQLRFTTVAGTATFDSGSISVLYD